MGKNIHVVHSDDNWKVLQENAKRCSGKFNTQKEAFESARKKAIRNNQEVVIHGLNGKIRAKYSYGNDPFPPEG